MKISAVNSSSNFVSKQKYSPASRGKGQILTEKSVLKKAIIPAYTIAATVLLSGCLGHEECKNLKADAEKERKEAIVANFQGDTINNKAYKDAIEFGNVQQESIEYRTCPHNEKFNIFTSRLKSLLQTATSPESEGGVNLTLNEKATIDAVINGSVAPCSRGNNSATKEVYRQQMSNRALRSFK